MANETPRLPEGGAWMGAFYVLPCKDASEHFAQAAAMFEAEEAGKDCDISYTNALYCGVYPCFISDAVDVDTTCFDSTWPDESFELMQQAGSLINMAILAYHRCLIKSLPVTALAMRLKEYIAGADIHIEVEFAESRPFMPILNWEPAKGGSDALAALQPLFPPAPPAQPEV